MKAMVIGYAVAVLVFAFGWLMCACVAVGARRDEALIRRERLGLDKEDLVEQLTRVAKRDGVVFTIEPKA